MGRPKAPCGTDAAYRRHLRDGEEVDADCRRAHREKQRDARRSPAAAAVDAESSLTDESEGEPDDLQLIVDTLRTVFKKVAQEDPVKVAPIAREFRSAVEAARGPQEQPKELSLADQLAAARAARAARAAS